MNSFTSSVSGSSVCFGRYFCVLDVLLCSFLRLLQCCFYICVLDVFASTAPQYRVCGERVPKVSQGAPTTNHRTNHPPISTNQNTLCQKYDLWSGLSIFFGCVGVCGANSKLEQHFIACPLNEWTTTTKQREVICFDISHSCIHELPKHICYICYRNKSARVRKQRGGLRHCEAVPSAVTVT